MKFRSLALVALAVAPLACEPAPAEHPEPIDSALPAPAPPPVSLEGIAKYFPLLKGHIYQYVTQTDDGDGVMMTRVTRADAQSGELSGPQGTKSFQYAADGVVMDAAGVPIYVLKSPLDVGNKWPGRGGSTVEIVEVNAKVTVAAGVYDGCIKTVEQRGGDIPMRIATTYCPDVGIVVLEAASGMALERAELMSYGPPVDLGPDGVKAIPPPQ